MKKKTIICWKNSVTTPGEITPQYWKFEKHFFVSWLESFMNVFTQKNWLWNGLKFSCCCFSESVDGTTKVDFKVNFETPADPATKSECGLVLSEYLIENEGQIAAWGIAAESVLTMLDFAQNLQGKYVDIMKLL